MSLADAIKAMAAKVPPVPPTGNPREPLQATASKGFPEVPPVPPENFNVQSAGSELSGCGQSGNDIEAANDRVLVHVPEYRAQSGKRYSFDLDLPRANLPALRQSLRFELIGDQGGGSILGKPGASADEVRAVLVRKYGTRLASINGMGVCDD